MKTLSWVKRALSRMQTNATPSTFSDLLAAANAARDRKDWLSSAKFYRYALEIRSEEHGLRVQLGHALKELGDYAGAAQEYRKYLKVFPNDADIHLQIGHLFNRQDRADDAISWYEKAAELVPENQEVLQHLQRAQALVEMRPATEARRKVLVLTDQRKWSEAHERLAELVHVRGHADLNLMLGNVSKELGRFEEAWACYRIVEVTAHAHDDLRTLLDVTLQMGHLSKVEKKFMEALSYFATVKDAALHRNLGDLYKQAWSEIRFIRAQFTSVFE